MSPNKPIPDCSDQLREYLFKACDIVDDICKKEKIPKDSLEGINYTLQMIGASEKSDKIKGKAMKEFENYKNDKRECKI